MAKAVNEFELLPARELDGKNILLTGTTGFVGKVVLSMLLKHYPSVKKIYALIRPGIQAKSQQRFNNSVIPSPALDPLREIHGDNLQAFLAEKVAPIDGNVVKENCGISDKDMQTLVHNGLDVIINSAGLVDFDPAIDQALGINAFGADKVVRLAKHLNAGLVHISTCYVNGSRAGQVYEDDAVLGYFPKQAQMGGEVFDHRLEIQRLKELTKQVREQVDDPRWQSLFRKQAMESLEKEGRDSDDPKTLKSAILRQRKRWLMLELKRVGMERAQFWGWQNTYTYTKSLGEQIIAEALVDGGLKACIVRPSIVESALRFPFEGWNEGFTTTAPLILLARQGLRDFPYAEELVLDIIPVDMVAATIVAATAAVVAGEHQFVYQAASGAVNPLTIKKAIEFTGFGVRDYANRTEQKGLKGFMLRNHEMQPISGPNYLRRGAPKYREIASGLFTAMQQVGPKRLGWARKPAQLISDLAKDVENKSNKVEMVMDLFLPFVAGEAFIFRSDNVQSLVKRLPEADRAILAFAPEAFLWRDYFRKVHVPGLEKWVLPKLEAELDEQPKHAYVFRSLVELFHEATHKYRHKVAFKYITSQGVEHLTFGEVRLLAKRVAGFLNQVECACGDRVVMVCENRPEWAATYFGIQFAGLTAIPVDWESTSEELANISQAADAKGIVVSPKVAQRLKKEGGLSATNELLTLDNPAKLPIWPMPLLINSKQTMETAARPARIASIIFTSGTTGQPKGVMLSQRNFTFEVSRLGGVFDLGRDDHLLSVLPIHHTFEFTAGLLVPFSRGCQITYLEELNGDTLSNALEGGVSGLIGVPALWELLERKIDSKISEAGPLSTLVMDGVRNVNLFLREQLDINAGSLMAYPVHRALGGRLKYLISGGSALSPEVSEFFRGLGFDLTQGYGLTETAPVLTVSDPRKAYVQGSVGKALPGIEIKIDSPDLEGIGEVWARGPNIMQGYYGNEQATEAVLVDGWLKTGDLGYLDKDENLFLVGRVKDVIIDRDGRNVYPDELEDAYGGHGAISELSVVGLLQPDGNEKVACLIVPDDEYSFEVSIGRDDAAFERVRREQLRELIDGHLQKVSAGLPYYKRIKVIHFWDNELPRTATRKVKRKEVIRIIDGLEKSSVVMKSISVTQESTGPLMLAQELIASLVGRSVSEVSAETRLAIDLGFDSLLFVELGAALAPYLRDGITNEDIVGAQTVADVAKMFRAGGERSKVTEASPNLSAGSIVGSEAVAKGAKADPNADQYPIAKPIARLGKRLLGWGQQKFYQHGMDTNVVGRQLIPKNENFLVAANHTSHLDAGLVKTALGEYGRNLVTLAARDYFFGDKLRRTYFENFTNIIAIERHGSVKQSLRRALDTLKQGKSLLLFPEGTRSDTGEMNEFKATVGYLALQSHRPVVPMYLRGTFEAMPKGATLLPSTREIGCVIGPALRWEHFKQLEAGRPRNEAYRLCTLLIENGVAHLKEHGTYDPLVLIQRILKEFPISQDHGKPVVLEEPKLVEEEPKPKKVRRSRRVVKNERPEL